ncbi:MAG: peptide chain release factor 3, partial [Leptolyngbyaceae cyanobacterium CAN_BIN12]|nr:peptide chain release factor 3 [Leptolyngbyaceae cyanobacterium CAN_BIN12]
MFTEIQAELQTQVERRRNFAIISHPDAGKTTLTEKLLLYGGAIHQAGAVKARRAQRHATSDWMEMEQQRGISITSTVLQFDYKGFQINLLDTPGHQDFSEDTYRTLAAADNAVMLIDAAKGLEPPTRKLFEVCRLRGLPIFTFVNKLDRPGREPLELLDEIEQELGLATYAANWPIGMGDRFKGVFERSTQKIHLFERSAHGQREAVDTMIDFGDPRIEQLLEQDLYYQFKDDLELLEGVGSELDLEAVHAGMMTPVFFGSAMTNFGVEPFLNAFLDYALKPTPHVSNQGEIEPTYPDFSGFIFKLQANMDPK